MPLSVSPDGKWLASTTGGGFKKVSLEEGAPIVLTQTQVHNGASWGDGGRIALGIQDRLWVVSENGGTPER